MVSRAVLVAASEVIRTVGIEADTCLHADVHVSLAGVDGVMLIKTLNKILSKTAFPNKPCSPCVLITLILPWLCILPIWYFTYSIGILSEMDSNQLSSFFPELSEVGINTDKDVEDRSEQMLTTFLIVLITVTIIVGLCIPFTIYFCFQCVRKSERKRKLL